MLLQLLTPKQPLLILERLLQGLDARLLPHDLVLRILPGICGMSMASSIFHPVLQHGLRTPRIFEPLLIILHLLREDGEVLVERGEEEVRATFATAMQQAGLQQARHGLQALLEIGRFDLRPPFRRLQVAHLRQHELQGRLEEGVQGQLIGQLDEVEAVGRRDVLLEKRDELLHFLCALQVVGDAAGFGPVGEWEADLDASFGFVVVVEVVFTVLLLCGIGGVAMLIMMVTMAIVGVVVVDVVTGLARTSIVVGAEIIQEPLHGIRVIFHQRELQIGSGTAGWCTDVKFTVTISVIFGLALGTIHMSRSTKHEDGIR
mmetsp:Transcript_19277/g.53610  ORF Transcript_19277/g.53610 Transcript_19277/m.53610 type:complete len:317 (+) Transcript_19277:758-1708(+)